MKSKETRRSLLNSCVAHLSCVILLGLLAWDGVSEAAADTGGRCESRYSSSWAVTAPGELGRSIDGMFDHAERAGGPGILVATLQHGKVTHLKGYGYANREYQAPWTDETPYTFYSVTKPILATALLRLSDAGRIDLDKPVREYLPEFPQYSHEPTVRELLQHTSGIWQDEHLLFLVGVGAAHEELTIDELYRMVLKAPTLSFRPGSAQYYSDVGMRIAARVLQRVVGGSFEQAMHASVLGPAGMVNTVHRLHSTSLRPCQANTYLLDVIPPTDVAQDELMVPFIATESDGDGGLVGTMQDLIAFAKFAEAAGPSGSYVMRLAEPVTYGPGVVGPYRTSIRATRHRGVEIYSHSGLFGKRLAYIPAIKAWFITMANAIGGNPDLSDRKYFFALADLLLRDSGRFTDRFGPDAESMYGTEGRPPNQEFSPLEVAQLTGVFQDPISGGILRIAEEQGHLRHSYLFGTSGYLVRHDKMDYASWAFAGGERIKVQNVDGSINVQIADWPDARSLQRLPTDYAPSQEDTRSMAGSYLSEAYGSIYHVKHDEDGDELYLRVGAGARLSDVYRLHAVGPDVFEARQQGEQRIFGQFYFQLRVLRHKSKVQGLAFDGEDLRGFVVDKLE